MISNKLYWFSFGSILASIAITTFTRDPFLFAAMGLLVIFLLELVVEKLSIEDRDKTIMSILVISLALMHFSVFS